jgi:Flp pilus assembly pilin Flp
MRSVRDGKKAQLYRQFRHGEDGATMLEYALLIMFVAIACVLAVTALGESLKTPLQRVITTGLS